MPIFGGSGSGTTDHSALTNLDADDHLQYALADGTRGDFASEVHTHAQSDVTGLVAALAGKAALSHSHVSADITDFTAAVDALIAAVVDGAPGALDTLNELAAALGDDANFASTVTTALAGKQPLDSDLTAIAGIAPSDDDIIQRKAGAWINRTPAQLKTDLSLTKSDVGLGNVDNTSDANKPVSTAQQTALDGKSNVGHTHAAADITDFDTQVRTNKIHQLALPTAATPMNGQIFTGLGAGTAAGHSVRYEQVVRLVDAQTIAGVKTFSDIPELPAVNPTTANQATRKQYVDDAIAALIDSSPATLDTLNELAAALGDDPNFATTITTALGLKLDAAVAATTYLKLDTSNDPLTGNLTISKSTPTLQLFDSIGGESLLRDTGLWFYAIAGDANPTALLRGDGFSKLAFGAGAASPLDWEMSRTAANVVSLATGDDLRRPAGEDGTHDDSMVRKAQLAAKNITVTETGLIIPSSTNVQQAMHQIEESFQNLEEKFEQHVHPLNPYGWIYNSATSGTIVAITASGGFIAIPWNADLYDKWDAHDPVTNNTRIQLGRIATGIWEVGATMNLGSPSLTAGQDFYMSVRKNGSAATTDQFWGGGYFAPPTVGVAPIPGMMTSVHINSSTDYIEVGAQIDGGTTPNMTGNSGTYALNKCWFKYIGPA